jgi:hypothetical protein
LSGVGINGNVLDKTLVGSFGPGLSAAVRVYEAVYAFREWADLNGRFKCHIEGGEVTIRYDGSVATITGKTDADNVFDFEGQTRVSD